MNRDEFLRELSRELRRLPRDEYEKAMDYYVEFFNDAGPENEKTVIADLGTPKEVAAQIIMDAAVERMHEPPKSARRGLGTIWMVILGVCAAPIAPIFHGQQQRQCHRQRYAQACERDDQQRSAPVFKRCVLIVG